MSLYNNEFYENRHKNTLYSAETILSIVQNIVPEIRSAIDLGCGVGTWLSVIQKNGAKVCGVDGAWVNKDYLVIQKEDFIEYDFSKDANLNIDRTYDLAISLEVAEHLPSDNAKRFVSSLTSLSEFVLFSAAIPYQGGVGHVNEQWADYWICLFENRGYIAFDIIRKRIWNDKSIHLWYRQNTLLFVKKERTKDLKIEFSLNDHIPPEVYSLSFKKAVHPEIKQSLKGLSLAIVRRLRRIFGTGR